MKTIRIFSFLLLFLLINCRSDSDQTTINQISGNYKLLRVTVSEPVDYNADGIFETDVTNYFSCAPKLIISNDGTMKYPSININIANYSMEMGTGYMISYETPECESPIYNAIFKNFENNISVYTEWGDNLTFYKKDSNILYSNFNSANLVIEDSSGHKILKRVSLEFQYIKN